MHADLDMPTINAATKVVVEAMQSAVCQWEQQSQDAAYEGNLTSALMYKNWAFAADLMAKTAASSLSNLMVKVYDQKHLQVRIPVETADLEPLPA